MALFLTLYTGRDCPECDEAWERLQALGPQLRLQVHRVDITGQKELEEKWKQHIPVGMMLGKVLFKGKYDEMSVRRKVKSLTRGR